MAMKPPNKYAKAYVASHLYHALTGLWPEKDWDVALKATDPLYFAAMNLDPHVSTDTLDLYRMLMDIHEL